MPSTPALKQHIAVFGESGSGKTVLLSSFYGATQEPQFIQKNLFRVMADDVGQGTRLHQNYLGMKRAARRPLTTRFASTSYAFTLRLREGNDPSTSKSSDALTVVWHDYPGDWFEEEAQSAEEAQRRLDTFEALLSADVALLLVDGQRLLDHAGEEERYLKGLFTNFKNGLLRVDKPLRTNGARPVQFPRIWVVALSKSDLLPDVDVFEFRDLVIEKAADELDDLRQVIGGLVQAREALSVGEDFMLLSSAKFEANRIDISERVGLEMLLPLAAVFPFERHVEWTQANSAQAKVLASLVDRAESVATLLLGARGRPKGRLGFVANMIGPDVLGHAARMVGERLTQLNAQAIAKRNYLSATLSQFRIDLTRGEEKKIFLRRQ